MAPAHTGIGHIEIQAADAQHQQHELEAVEQPAQPARQHIDHAARGGGHIGGDGNAGPQQQRPQRHGRPVKNQALLQGPGVFHPPDLPEGALDGDHQGQCGQEHRHQTDRAQTAGLARELGQVTQHLARDALGHQALDQPALDGVLEFAKERKGREHRQPHREQGNQGQHGGEGQRTRAHAQPRFAKAAVEHAAHLAPGEFGQLLPPSTQASEGSGFPI